jgi:hypothetical protein
MSRDRGVVVTDAVPQNAPPRRDGDIAASRPLHLVVIEVFVVICAFTWLDQSAHFR